MQNFKEKFKSLFHLPNVLSVILVGSHARNAAREDSDIDLVIISDEPLKLLEDLDWIDSLGEVISWDREDWGLVQSIRVFYKDGSEVELGITSKEWIKIDPIDPATRRILQDGHQVLFDPKAMLDPLLTLISQ